MEKKKVVNAKDPKIQEEQALAKGQDLDVSFSKGQIIVKGMLSHEIGYVNVELGGNALPFINQIIDKLEDVIPGDQKGIASSFKALIAGLEF